MKNWVRCCCFFFSLFLIAVTASGQVPSTPGNFTISPGLLGSAVLHWNNAVQDSNIGPHWFQVYRSFDDLVFNKIGETDHTDFIDFDLSPHLTYYYFVRGVDSSGEGPSSDTLTYQLDRIPPTPIHGTVQGKVLDESTGLPLKNAVVNFFNLHTLWLTSTHSDTAGNYQALLDTGRYLLRATDFGYIPEWFDNTQRLDSATVVRVQQDSSFTANFGLSPIFVPHPATLSGTVVDSATGLPIPKTLVLVMRTFRDLRRLEELTEMFSGFDKERFDFDQIGRFEGVVWAGLTDSSGNYNANLLTGTKYIVMAFKPGYILQFYNDKITPFEADRIVLSGDTTGISFTLVPNPLAVNSLSGTVSDSSGDGIPAHVVLYRRTVAGLLPVRYRMTDSVGNFTFTQLVDGIFMIKAYPVTGYAPAWYSASTCGVWNWHNADTLHVHGDVTGVTLCVQPAPEGWFGVIAGQVNLNLPPSARKNDRTLSSNGLNGVTVYAVSTADNTVVTTDVTEEDGSFSLPNLPAGNYSILVDKEGYTGIPASNLTVNQSNNYQVSNSSVTITPDVPLSVKNESPTVPSIFRLEQNFPNPFNPTTQIHFEIPTLSRVIIKVYNLIGQQVAVLINETRAAGAYSVEWNATDNNNQQVGSGIYFVKMFAEPLAQHSSPFTQIRKMILLR
jgi:hypothetical protein